MTTTNEELRRLADAATPGPWTNISSTSYEPEEKLCIQSENGAMFIYDEGGHTIDDARFIAAANPAKVRELLDHIATLEQESAANLQRALVAEKSTLTIALPDYDPRRIVIASDDYDDGERIVCVAIDNNGYVMLPNADNMTDEQAEAIAKAANCCGGIAESIYRAIVDPRRRRSAIKTHDTSTQEVG